MDGILDGDVDVMRRHFLVEVVPLEHVIDVRRQACEEGLDADRLVLL